MPGVACGRVRAVLAEAATGHALASDDAWETLLSHGAVEGSASSPQITAVGRHVLAELEVRASRTDALPLDVVANQLSRVHADLDQVAKTAEYFLAELGPVTPPEAVPLLRPVAVGLANRRETPEELAAEFRNLWGSVEVMGGDSRDRLLAAELLNASDASMEKVYAPLMVLTSKIRERFGPTQPAVAPAALLQLHPGPSGEPALEAFIALRGAGLGAEEAGLLAGIGGSATDTLARRQAVLTLLTDTGASADSARYAASLLVTTAPEPARLLPRIQELTTLLTGRIPAPITASALLSTMEWLEPKEIVDWVEKAIGILRTRRIAPTDPELAALGVALVHGLPHSEFVDSSAAESPPRSMTAGLLTLHAWIYRPLVRAASNSVTPSAAAN